MAFFKLKGFTEEEFNTLTHPITKELIKDFLRSQAQLSEQTLKQYRSALYIFAKYLYENLDNKPVTELKTRDALRYQNFLIDLGLSDSGIKFKKSVVSSLFLFIEGFWDDEYPNVRNIFTKAVPVIGNEKKKEKIPLTIDEISKLKEVLTEREEWEKLAYLLFSYSTGCRREEARQLRTEVVNYDKFVNSKGEQKNYYVTHSIRAKGRGKTGKVRKFQFDGEAMDAIKKWIEIRNVDHEYVFTSNVGGEVNQVNASTFNGWCDYFSTIIDKKVHPHLIRSSRATNSVVEEGKDIKAVQQLLGHNSSSTTEIYVVRDSEDDIDELF